MPVEAHRPLYDRPAFNLGEARNPITLRPVKAADQEGSGKGGGKSHGELDQEHGDWRDRQPLTVACICGEFTAEGPAAEARARFQAHLEEAHPERVGRKPRRNRGSWEKANGAELETAMPLVAERAAAAVASEQRKEIEMEEKTVPQFACDQCDRRFVTAQALAIHRGRSHKAHTPPDEKREPTRAPPKPRDARQSVTPPAASNGHKPTSPVELAREIVLLSEEVTNLEAELIGKYARLGELGQELAQIGASR